MSLAPARSRRAAVRGAALLTAAAAVSLLTAPSAVAEEVTIGSGHVDIGPRLVEGEWIIEVRDDSTSPERWLPVDEVTLHVAEAALIDVPAEPAYAFLAPAEQIWLLPQTQDINLLWPGWNTQHSSVNALLEGPVDWQLDAVDGPGRLTIFSSGAFGEPEILFDSAAPLPQSLPIPVNSHVHGNWTFDAPGRYLIDITMSGVLTGIGEVTDSATLQFTVGDEGAVAPSEDPSTSAAVDPATTEPVTSEDSATTASEPETTAESTPAEATTDEVTETSTTAVPTAETSAPVETTASDSADAAESAEESSSSAWLWWALGGVVVLAAAIVLVLRRRGSQA